MRWTQGGPDLPPELLQAQEDGKLVLFCGAGVSRRAGLPDFKGLVETVFARLHQQMERQEQQEFDKGHYDRVLGLLETRIGRAFVRPKVMEALRLDEKADISTHRALLSLAKNRDGEHRLVTTNFDNGLELAAEPWLRIDSAPRLPLPKLKHWNSVVHLHGRICNSDSEGLSLVLTSADFGAAYLTEGWASRFISDLFRRFVILFIGYSVDDPVVRYMMDAFAADRELGEGINKAYVLAPADDSDFEASKKTWEAKGVIPVLYDSRNEHQALHDSLAKWAERHRQGLQGRMSVVVEFANTPPPPPFEHDPVASQMLWALSESSGAAAARFAGLNPVPPLRWLDVFTDKDFKLLNLSAADDRVTLSIFRWVLRHLHELKVLKWAIESDLSRHRAFRALVRESLSQNPALPAGMTRIWNIISNEARLCSARDGFRFDIQKQILNGHWTPQLRFELMEALKPVLTFRPPVMVRLFGEEFNAERVDHCAEAEVILQCGVYSSTLSQAIHASPACGRILLESADDLTGLLKRALELFALVDKADAEKDPSIFRCPVILGRRQGRGRHDWTILIELVRDSWYEVLDTHQSTARRLAERWRTIPFPIFRRLALYAMAHSEIYTAEESLSYLLEDEGRWLWSHYVHREKLSLIRALWPKLSAESADHLLDFILAGPPRGDLSHRDTEWEIWRMLAELRQSGRELPSSGAARLRELEAANPGWIWREDSDFEVRAGWLGAHHERHVESPEEFFGLSEIQVEARVGDLLLGESDDLARWRNLVASQPEKAASVLNHLARTGRWPVAAWQAAIQTLMEKKRPAETWPALGEALAGMPDDQVLELRHFLPWYLEEVSKEVAALNEELFWRVWDHLRAPLLAEDGDDSHAPVTAAINSPSGKLTEALLHRFHAAKPEKSDDVPQEMWDRLSDLQSGQTQASRHARVILATRLAWFHAINRQWAEQHQLPYFDWQRNLEAPRVWQGFLWQPRISPELWAILKADFLMAFSEKRKLGKFAERIAQVFAHICLSQSGWIKDDEARAALQATDAEGRGAVANYVKELIEGAQEQGEVLWRERIGPWLDHAWPKDRKLVEAESSLNFAMAVTFTGAAFPQAVTLVAPFLTDTPHWNWIIDRLHSTDHPQRHPKPVLDLLNRIVGSDCHWINPELREILSTIQSAQPELKESPQFRRLDELLLKRSGP